MYGSDYSRKKAISTINNTETTKYYSGIYEKSITLGQTKELYYIMAYGSIVAMYEKTSTAGKMFYVHTDHLGSVNCVTDSTGSIVQESSYDAWGNRRDPVTLEKLDTIPTNLITTRGYTGHEHMDEFGLINMNGRVYDPKLARFLNPDPVIANPTFTQDYNAYSYVRNNPLGYVDPSGYIIISAAVRAMVEEMMDRSGERGGTWSNSGGGSWSFKPFNSDEEAFQTGFRQVYGFNCPISMSEYSRMASLNGWYSSGSRTRMKISFGKPNIGLLRLVKGFQNGNKVQWWPRFNLGISFSLVEGETEEDNSGIENFATFLRESPFLISPKNLLTLNFLTGLRPNPFFKAEALYIDAGVTFCGAECDEGMFFMLAGDDLGKVIPYSEFAGGGGSELSLSGEIGRVDVRGVPSGTVKSSYLQGPRRKASLGGSFLDLFNFGGAFAWNSFDLEDGTMVSVNSTSFSVGVGVNPFSLSVLFNVGEIKFH
jgi:RHS repeat-associated protein